LAQIGQSWNSSRFNLLQQPEHKYSPSFPHSIQKIGKMRPKVCRTIVFKAGYIRSHFDIVHTNFQELAVEKQKNRLLTVFM
jgi:hypothetical protein